MTRQEMTEKINTIVSQKFKVPVQRLTPESSLFKDFGADSVEMVELMEELEQTFAISPNPDDEERVRTVGDVFRFIESQVKLN